MTPDIESGSLRSNFCEGGEIPTSVVKRAGQIASRELTSFGEKNKIAQKYIKILRENKREKTQNILDKLKLRIIKKLHCHTNIS